MSIRTMNPFPPSASIFPASTAFAPRTWLTGFAWVCGAVLSCAPAAEAQIFTASASTGYGSGNTGFGGTVFSGYPLPANGTTPSVALSAGLLSADGDATSKMSTGTLSVSGMVGGASNTPVDNHNYYVSGGGSINFNDTLTLSSSSLPAGTPVTLTFSIEIAYVATAQHTIGTLLGSNQQQNNARYLLAVGAGASDTFGGGSFYMDSNLNKAYFDTAPGSGTKLGIFTGTQHVDFTVGSQVGHTVSFGLSIQASASLDVAPASLTGFGPLLNQSGSALAELGTAFGASADNPAVVLSSAKLGGAFPAASLANPMNAAAAVPEPGAVGVVTALGLVGFSAAGAWKRNRDGGR